VLLRCMLLRLISKAARRASYEAHVAFIAAYLGTPNARRFRRTVPAGSSANFLFVMLRDCTELQRSLWLRKREIVVPADVGEEVEEAAPSVQAAKVEVFE
jgi:hypothetical protein